MKYKVATEFNGRKVGEEYELSNQKRAEQLIQEGYIKEIDEPKKSIKVEDKADGNK